MIKWFSTNMKVSLSRTKQLCFGLFCCTSSLSSEKSEDSESFPPDSTCLLSSTLSSEDVSSLHFGAVKNSGFTISPLNSSLALAAMSNPSQLRWAVPPVFSHGTCWESPLVFWLGSWMRVKPPGSNTPCWVWLLVPWLVGGQILNEKVPVCPKKLGVFSDGETVRETFEVMELFWKVVLWQVSPLASVWTGVWDGALCGGSSSATKPLLEDSSSDCWTKKNKQNTQVKGHIHLEETSWRSLFIKPAIRQLVWWFLILTKAPNQKGYPA